MRFSALAVFATLGSVALAQNLLSGLPDCAKNCVGSNFGGCALLDIKCICGNKDLIGNLSCCVAKACSAEDQASTIKFAVQLCQANGIPVPTSASCAAGSESTTSSAAPSASGASNGTVTTHPPSTTTGAANAAKTTPASTGGAAVHTMGAHLGMGIAMAGLFVAL